MIRLMQGRRASPSPWDQAVQYSRANLQSMSSCSWPCVCVCVCACACGGVGVRVTRG